ncbi:mannose-6-phosphate isomerase [Prolixibacteraceae bacterium JC049]|jgi:mannose-6-phosphate isomerase|nr:mannose-6-phosphate isomerase [Prolixibacteraceae bacterium JC049]
MSDLYPLKFEPIYKDKIWGGDKLKTHFQKNFEPLPNCGESWELSGVAGNVSTVSNGFLKGNNLQELIEIYMGDLVGEGIYERFGEEFPLLIKFIDANDDLSIQVHPDDEMSKERHNAFGKTEMWYVLQADEGAKLVSGFNQEVDKEKYLKYLKDNQLTEILNAEEVKAGDVFFMPAGRVHAIGSGLVIAEIQQTSDVTYRIYDYNRKDDKGNTRELHTDLALDAIDFTLHEEYKTNYTAEANKSSELAKCEYFTTNVLELTHSVEKEYNQLDSFIIYMCLEGECVIGYGEDKAETMKKGDTVLMPANIDNFTLVPKNGTAKMLEVYIEE